MSDFVPYCDSLCSKGLMDLGKPNNHLWKSPTISSTSLPLIVYRLKVNNKDIIVHLKSIKKMAGSAICHARISFFLA